MREEENEEAIGGLRNAARSVVKVPQWSAVGTEKFGMIQTLVK